MNRLIKRSISRSLSFGLLAVCIIAAPLAFAQDSYELPEPVFNNSSIRITPVFTGTAGLWLPNLDEIVYYLWNFDYIEPGRMQFLPNVTLAQAASTDASIPSSIRNNRFFIESVRLTNLAQQAFEDGDYAQSKVYSDEAIRYAQLSDDYVRLQLKIKETDDAITAARLRLEWASSNAVDAARRFPAEFSQAQAAYNEARSLRTAEQWDDAIAAASRVLNALAMVTEAPPVVPAVTPPAPAPEPPPAPTTTLPMAPAPVPEPTPAPAPAPVPVVPSEYPLPAQYTVRPWAITKDCLWNIAGRPWAYGDPNQWRLLYNANRAKMPEPDNPDLIHPGMVLDIPSIRGETREGMWVDGRTYVPLR